jgi:hypothetical protein
MLILVGLALTAQTAFAEITYSFPGEGSPSPGYCKDMGRAQGAWKGWEAWDCKVCVVNATQSCNGKVVGFSHPWIAPQPVINITGNTTMVATPSNATAATNEHDYNIGFKIGYNDYHQSSTDSGLDVYVSSNDDVDECNAHADGIASRVWGWGPHDIWRVTNATACRDGYTGGWKSWCKSNGLECAYWASTGSVPSLVLQSEKVNRCFMGFCLSRQMLANAYHQPS